MNPFLSLSLQPATVEEIETVQKQRFLISYADFRAWGQPFGDAAHVYKVLLATDVVPNAAMLHRLMDVAVRQAENIYQLPLDQINDIELKELLALIFEEWGLQSIGQWIRKGPINSMPDSMDIATNKGWEFIQTVTPWGYPSAHQNN